MDNPFASIVHTIRDDNKSQIPAYYRLGIVSSVEPLRIDVAGVSQDESVLLKNNNLTSLEIGDKLYMVPIEDEQRYIIVCKVVST